MNIDGLVEITALIRPNMEGHVVRALHELPEFPGFFITDVRGQGHGRGQGGAFISSEWDLTYHRYLKLSIVCRSDQADDICNAIVETAWTGHKGDGILMTSPVGRFGNIRELGSRARPA